MLREDLAEEDLAEMKFEECALAELSYSKTYGYLAVIPSYYTFSFISIFKNSNELFADCTDTICS